MTISILIVDDEEAIKETTEEFLKMSGYIVQSAGSAEEAVNILQTFHPKIVLTDITMQGMDGLELTQLIKKKYAAEVIVMTGYCADYSYEEAIFAGASDFIFKPFRFEELNLRIKRVVREIKLKKKHVELIRELKDFAITDALTNLYNSKYFFENLPKEIERHNRYQHPLSLLMIDIDKFKDYNDSWGHLEGDKVLMKMGEIITSCLRSMDTGYRYGGEEFTVLLPETDLNQALRVGERIRKALSEKRFYPDTGEEVSVTISIGATEFSTHDDLHSFVKRADMAMYRSKNSGRNTINFIPPKGKNIQTA
ncbi:MAG: diguanylate cyclase [Thermodesulfobacteriota bacterium]|nr:diguanylate cyclase [Thermodesulfobacteriota bacterium]